MTGISKELRDRLVIMFGNLWIIHLQVRSQTHDLVHHGQSEAEHVSGCRVDGHRGSFVGKVESSLKASANPVTKLPDNGFL